MTRNKPSTTCPRPMRSLIAGACLLIWAAAAIAAPFDRWIEYTQPDGKVIRIHGAGDEFSAHFKAEDGYTVVFDTASKAYCYAQLDGSGALISTGVKVGAGNPPAGIEPGLRMAENKRREMISERFQKWEAGMQTRSRWAALKETAKQHYGPRDPNGPQMAPPPFTTIGLKVGLTMLIDFTDVASTVPQAEIVNFLNADNYTGFGNNGSVKKYFQDNSGGLLTYSNVCTIYIRAPQPKTYYADVTKDCGTQGNLLIKDCVEVMKALPNYNTEILPLFDALTTDAQNQVIAFNVFYTGDDGGVWAMGLWPHSSALYDVGPQELSPGGKKLWRYQVTNIGNQLSIGTFCHENGHMLCGYPDIYDYDYDSVGGAGYFCLMDYGGFDKNPVQICAYLKRASGWATITEVTETSSLLARASSEGAGFNHFYRYQKPNVDTEYYLIENRQASGRDALLPGSGLAIWHCDELGDKDDQSLDYNTSHSNYEVTLVQADNRWDFQNYRNGGDPTDLWYAGNPAPAYPIDFSDDTQPSARWWDGTRSGLMISEISASGVSMTFRAGFGMPLRIASTEVAGGNLNGVVDPNECNQLFVALYNDSDVPITGISARLSSSTPGVIIAQRNSAYADLAPHSTNVNLTAFQISTSPGFICGTPIYFTLSLTTDEGAGAVQFQLESGLIGQPLEFSQLVPVPIPDDIPTGADSHIMVSNLVGALQKVTVSLHIPHTWAGDLMLQLVSPNGITNTLSAFHGFGGNNYGLNCGARTVFDDASSNAVANAGAPFYGVFSPDEPLSVYNGLSGTNLNGRWTLHVVDALQLDVGTIQCWSLHLTMPTCQDGLGECPGSDLGVEMSASPNPCIIGQPLTYTIAVTNRGPSTAKTVLLNHVLPAGAIVNALTPSQGSASYAGNLVTCNFGPIGALGSAALTVRVTPTVPGQGLSSATVTSEQQDYNPGDNVVTLNTQVNPPTADLALGLNAVPSGVVLGEQVNLTVNITNRGPSSAAPVMVTNLLPAGLVLDSSTISQGTVYSPSSGIVVCSFGTLTNSARAVSTLHLRATGEGQLYVQSRAVANQFDPISANSSASVLIAVGPAADLSIGISDIGSDPVLVNSNFTWTAAVTNSGPSQASGVVVTLNLPAGVSVVSSNTSRGTLSGQGSVVTGDIGTMAPGSVEVITIRMRSSVAGVFSGSGSVAGVEADLTPSNNSAFADTTVSLPFIQVVAASAYLMEETIPNGAIDSGETNRIVFYLKNVGNIAATNMVARLLQSGGVTPIGNPEQMYELLGPGGWVLGKPFQMKATGPSGSEVIATLEVSGSGTNFMVAFAFRLPSVQRFANTAAITIPSLGKATPYPSLINVSGVTGLVSKVAITVSNMTHTFPKDVSLLVAGPLSNACLVMSHAGRQPIAPVTLTFDDGGSSMLAASSQLVSGRWKPSYYSPMPTFAAPAPTSYATALSTFNSLNPNGTWSLYGMDDASGDAGAVNQGWAIEIETIQPVNMVADLSIAGAASPAPVLAGSQLEYVFTVTNAGPNAANGVLVTNAIPQNAVYVSSESSQGSVEALGDVLTASLGSIAPGSSATVRMTVVPTANALGSLACAAAVTANETDLNQVMNSVTVLATVNLPTADVAITQSSNEETVIQGGDVEVHIVVTNQGTGLALETALTNPVPAGMTFVSAWGSKGLASLQGGAVVCQFGDLAVGETAETHLTFKAVTAGVSSSSAMARSRSLDPDLSNNSAATPLTIVSPSPNIQIQDLFITSESLVPPNGAVDNGEAVTVQIGLANTGTAWAGSVGAMLVPVNGMVINGADTQAYGDMPVGGATVFKPFAFTASGTPGAVVTAELRVYVGNQQAAVRPVQFTLPAVSSYSNSAAILIPEVGAAGPYPSTIEITNAVGFVKSAKVTLNGLSHSFPRDLVVVVVAPNGASSVLMAHAGGVQSVTNAIVMFDDGAQSSLTEEDPITSGSWKPTAIGEVASLPTPAPAAPYGTSLGAFLGCPGNGTWSIYVADDTTSDGGAISSGWTLTLETADVVNPITDLSLNLTGSPATASQGDLLTHTVVVANNGPASAMNVSVSNVLPAGAALESVTVSGGTLQTNGSVVWNVGTIANAGMAECSLRFRLMSGGNFGSSATVSSWAYEFNTANNTGTADYAVAAVPTQPTLAAALAAGSCQITVNGRAGAICVTEWSDNLNGTWVGFSTNTIPQDGVLKVTDPQPSTQQVRFYRARLEN